MEDMSSSPDTPSSVAYSSKRSNKLPAAGFTKSGNKRRVRRIQVELPLLRQHVQELELQLKRTQLLRLNVAPPPAPPHGNNLDYNIQDVGSLWNRVAERQLNERLRLEQEQLDLKEFCKEMVDYSAEMQKLFTKFEEIQEEALERVGNCQQSLKFCDFIVHSDDDIFTDQMLVMAKLYLKVKQQNQGPCRTVTLGSGLAMGRDIPRLEPGIKAGIVFDAHCGVLLPFCLDVAAEAYWKFFKYDDFGTNTTAIESDNVVSFVDQRFLTFPR
ncbi:hypothetical protein P3T76_010503 [Phytophthora citrophthora]|uniref:Uncharacterized protein n=1 Tax=Phytophthora citrophthora TaxID=4793 RepID=A0AAD9GCE2_9STRA|nr:hypothetical protein P3T76_010503 [Phytophthora citrophthora]